MSQQVGQPAKKQATSESPLPPRPSAPPLPLHLPSVICFFFIVLFAIFFSALAVQQHHTFQTNGLDLGNVDQALWNTARGRFLQFTLMTPIESRLALHVEPILLLFVPLYWLNLGGPEALLIIQASVVALGAWPLYRLAQHKLLPLVSSPSRNPKYKIQNTKYKTRNMEYVSRLTPPGARKRHSSLFSSFILHPFGFAPHSLRSGTSQDKPSSLLIILPLAYLFLPTLQSAVLFEFHAVTLAPTFLLFAFLALEQKKDIHFIIFSWLAMTCKNEDMPLVVAMLGLYVGVTQRRWRLAGLTISLSAAWFFIALFIIQPHFAADGNIQLDYYAWLGDTPLEIIQTIITRPRLVFIHLWYQADLPGYLAKLFFPTAFLALLSPLTLLPMLPTLTINLLSGNPFTWRLEDFHYGAPLAPFLFISAIYGITWLIRRLEDWKIGRLEGTNNQPSNPPTLQPAKFSILLLLCLLLLTFTAIYHYHRGFTPLARPFIWPQVTAHHGQLEAVLQTIPPDTALFAQSNLAPHLTHRPTLYTDFAYFTDPNFPAPTPVDDILLDVTTFENIGGLHQFLRQTLLESGNYQVVTVRDGILHLRPLTTDHRPPTTDSQSSLPTPYSLLPTPFYTFVRPTPPLDYKLTVDFGSAIRLHGYSLHFNRQEEIQVTLDLEALQPLTDAQPVLYLLNATGQVTGATTDLQPTLVWFPPYEWPVGEVVRVRFNTLPWYTRQTKTYGLTLGIINGDEVWAVSRRYRPVITQSTRFATRLPADGTLVELARMEQVWGIHQGGPVVRQFVAPPLPHSLEANFDGQIKLLGHTAPTISRGRETQNLTLSLYWQAVNSPETLTRFVQLIGPDGQIYGQNDSAPDFGNYPTHLWQPGEIVQELVILPVQVRRPAGDYTLHVGLYRPDTGQRLSLVSGSDHVQIIDPMINKFSP